MLDGVARRMLGPGLDRFGEASHAAESAPTR